MYGRLFSKTNPEGPHNSDYSVDIGQNIVMFPNLLTQF